MEHLALYRKYRPASFDDVYGQDHVTSVLRFESSEGKLSHAYLFCGPRGTGKTTCAKLLAKAVNCESPVNGDPCGKCAACRSIDAETATDVVEMDAASNTGVDYIRDIKDEVSYTPAVLKKRVYIIDEVHMLSIGAFNALLKTLEEPPPHVLFILATTEVHKLPATVISRCQRFDFRRIPIDVIAARLSQIASLEKIDLDGEAAQMIAKQASGGMRDAINLMELCAGGGESVTRDRVTEALGITGADLSFKVACAVKNGDVRSLFSAVEYVVSSSKDLLVFFGELISFWRDMIVMKYSPSDDTYLDLTSTEKQMVKDAANYFTPEELLYHSGLLDSAYSDMNRLPQIKRYISEITLMKMSDKKLDSSTDSLLARISNLEDQIKLLLASGKEIESPAPEVVIPKIKPQDDPAPVDGASSPSLESRDAPSGGGNEERITDVGEFISRLSSIKPALSPVLAGAEFYSAGNKLLIKVFDTFSYGILTASDATPVLRDCAVVSGLFTTTPDVEIVKGEKADDGQIGLDEFGF